MAGTTQIKPVTSLALFASPDVVDPTLQSFLQDASARLCQWFGEATERGPLPADISLPSVRPDKRGLPFAALLDELQVVMEGAYQPLHPGALAHLDPPPLTASIAADLICSGLNNNLLAEELSPSLSRLEREICRWFADTLGLPSGSGGVAASGGSLSNLMALVAARNIAGLRDDSMAVVVASEDSHVSLLKAIRVMGLMDDALELIPTDDQGMMLLDLLRDRLDLLKENGRKCFAVVGTAGTTARGAVDPLVELREICSKQGIWLHVDAAIGGVFALSEQTSQLVNGIAKADSITLNPQKVLGIPKTSSLLLVADLSHLSNTFSTGLPYMEPAWSESHGGELGLQGSKPAEVLKLWLGLRQLGEEGINDLLVSAINRRCFLNAKLDASSFNILGGPLHLITFTPKNIDQKKSLLWSATTREALLNQKFMLSRHSYKGKYYLKAVLGNPNTKSIHLENLAKILNDSLQKKS
ncbi:pyridoxal phosphate-dependent decarboxylase family protein [Prochlorococcus sp. MIT 1341]|uniref:pyridoxal phosphate-dependent decarboxylase family protein n=1 Tax=Prochlorococcus sp. MIT 1341 TaxID=3096221 RepID=UPI002A748D5B|nr:pyridoxal-dependent decarboxylase [Prochlorococcus sp. MIT 1341]